MRTAMFALLCTVAVYGRANAADPMVIAANLGSQLGKATYCGFATSEFAERSGRALDAYTKYGTPERGEALMQFVTAATMAAQSGPIGESCEDFHEGYDESLQSLKNAGF